MSNTVRYLFKIIITRRRKLTIKLPSIKRVRNPSIEVKSMWRYNRTDELYHHGVKGMKWGVRRYQPYITKGKYMIGENPSSRTKRLGTKADRAGGKTEYLRKKQTDELRRSRGKSGKYTKRFNRAHAKEDKLGIALSKSIAKDKYRSNKKRLKKEFRKNWSDFDKDSASGNKEFFKNVRKNRSDYKSGKISKYDYRENLDNLWNDARVANSRREYKLAIDQYNTIKKMRLNKVEYASIKRGPNSLKCKAGKRALERRREDFSRCNTIFRVYKTADDRYYVSKTTYHYQ